MNSRSLILAALVVAAVCIVGVQSRPAPTKPQVRTDGSTFFDDPHAPTDAGNIDAKWAKINAARAALEARNYSRPNGGYNGVDVSAWAGQDTWSCLVQQGYSFAIVRNYQSNCQVDPNGVHTVANAWAAGVAHVDIYLFPSFPCGDSPAKQVDDAISSMGSIPFGTLWLDIEASGSGWSGDTGANNEWLGAAIQEAVNQLGASRVGIYSSAYGWSSSMGGWTGGADAGLPIWYAHYDNDPSFDDFQAFAGWSSPAMKQWAGDASVCSFDVDLNWYA